MTRPQPEPWRLTFSELVSPPADLIEEARNGRMFMLVDDEDRENEGDLVIPGADGHARGDQFHGQAWPRADLPRPHRGPGAGARPAADVLEQ